MRLHMEMVQEETRSIAAALACLALLYTLIPRLPRGLPRLLLLLPCLPVLAWLPFSTRSHFVRAILSFSFLWICPSKLLLLSWDLSPDSHPGHGFFRFFLTTVLPVRVKGTAPSSLLTIQGALYPHILNLSLFFVALNASQYRDRLSVWAIHALYCLLVFLGLQLVLGLSAKLANVLLGVETYPQFDHPFLASSLSEFWSRRWNLVASHMLRETVYAPILRLLCRGQHQATVIDVKHNRREGGNGAGTRKAKTMTSFSLNESIQTREPQINSTPEPEKLQQELSPGERCGGPVNTTKHPMPARAVAMLASFLASGLIHELIFYCINNTRATWEVTMFFILHGFATVLESFLRRELPAGWKLPQPVAIFCTLGFLFFSTSWLFMPPITRAGSDLRIIAEFHHVQSVVVQLLERH